MFVLQKIVNKFNNNNNNYKKILKLKEVNVWAVQLDRGFDKGTYKVTYTFIRVAYIFHISIFPISEIDRSLRNYNIKKISKNAVLIRMSRNSFFFRYVAIFFSSNSLVKK